MPLLSGYAGSLQRSDSKKEKIPYAIFLKKLIKCSCITYLLTCWSKGEPIARLCEINLYCIWNPDLLHRKKCVNQTSIKWV